MTRVKFNVVTRWRKAEQSSQRGDPGAPTTAEISKHQRKRQKQASETDKSSDRTFPVLSAHCCFIGGNMLDSETSMVFPHVCWRKGGDPDILETLVEDIEVLGYRQIVFRSDHENPGKGGSERAYTSATRDEDSPKYHSAANGRVENALQPVIGLTRVLKDALEASIKQTMEPNTLVMTFMVNHAATIINRFSVGQDGKTPMEKVRGTTANKEDG